VPLTQEDFDLLSRLDSCDARYQALRYRITADTVAAPEDGQWAQRIQGTAQTIELFALQRQTRPHGGFQPML
jgi:hypothetical protein